MFLSRYRRTSRWPRIVICCLIFLFLLDVFRLLGSHKTFSNNLNAQTVQHIEDLPQELRNQKIYIAAQFWTSEAVLVEFWLKQFLKLLPVLGPRNIYVSIIESGSLDNTADAIRWLDGELVKLGVARTVITDPTTHEDAVNAGPLDEHGHHKNGWIPTGDTEVEGQRELRRIPYLSDIRNRGLEPLLRMHRTHGRIFDKILYLNDVYFEPSDILTLLATNAGHYDIACGIDFHYPPAFYDTFALRDIEGRGPVMSTFPYFRADETRNALLKGAPAQVKSCWNGVLVVDAAPYYDRILPNTVGSGHHLQTGLRFRGIPDSLALHKLEASECCLIHADLIASGFAQRGIFLNPAVRSGYTTEAYELTHRGPDNGFVGGWQYVTGVWKNRFARWKTDGISSSAGQNMAEVYRRIRKWQNEVTSHGEKRSEVGDYCTIMEMHILIWNGWKHVW
ncbi:hypothetical protein PMZ80_009409 [Knufia obscura]|uniref:Glycosyltransferase family 69 protein n=2 Tax=Knufia TaxID=430999 RepID=A0AAN8IQB7_9EURO|nr:hypothetical protein PMZ80_009409 [Knufia obscura]KAK5955867.1 hypothetical protein OHC33_003508 [Knufia fluminis]